eukprot:4985530-Amphidinium_carterae.1
MCLLSRVQPALTQAVMYRVVVPAACCSQNATDCAVSGCPQMSTQAPKLANDAFGNFIIQKMFETASREEQTSLVQGMKGDAPCIMNFMYHSMLKLRRLPRKSSGMGNMARINVI